MKKKNITVIGLGGVGGYFGFKICQTNEHLSQHHVSFVARTQTYEKVKADGLTLLSPEHEIPVTNPDALHENIAEVSTPDLVIVCVKEYDLENVCEQLKSVIHPETIILPMMNGADIYDRIKAKLPNTTVLPSCVYVASHIKEKGIVEHKGKSGKLVFGKDPQHPKVDIQWIENLVRDSGIVYDFEENSFPAIWTKFIFIASFGLVSAKHNSSIGAVGSEPDQRKEAHQIMQEIKNVADAKGIHLVDDIIQKTFDIAATFPATTPTSLQLDVNSGKKQNELSLFAGAIIKYGKELDIETPSTERIYNEIMAKL